LDINTGRAEALLHDCLRHLSRKTFACCADAVVFGADAVACGVNAVVFGVNAVVLRRRCRRSSAAMPSFFGGDAVVLRRQWRSAGL
jgi:hypothetical protein